ncbi:hypothetical protein HDE77_002975 [Rhodanobacter sp. MP7CTX1]|nr:hypothetical protein [Rhodanobacter sp. MP7CTX1]
MPNRGTSSIPADMLGIAALTPTYAHASAQIQKILIPARFTHR